MTSALDRELPIRELAPDEAHRLAEIDRSERIRVGYAVEDGRLQSRAVEWDALGWGRERDGDGSVDRRIEQLQGRLDAGDTGLGVFEDTSDGELLVAYIVLHERLTPDTAQLAELFVSRSWRRRGLARRLTAELIERARAGGARSLYVSSAPTESAVGFYRSQGFELTAKPDPELYRLEPDDIHMLREL